MSTGPVTEALGSWVREPTGNIGDPCQSGHFGGSGFVRSAAASISCRVGGIKHEKGWFFLSLTGTVFLYI